MLRNIRIFLMPAQWPKLNILMKYRFTIGDVNKCTTINHKKGVKENTGYVCFFFHFPRLTNSNSCNEQTYISTQPLSPMISIAFRCSPAEMYISAAAFGSLMFLAQSACLVINILVSLGSPEPRKS